MVTDTREMALSIIQSLRGGSTQKRHKNLNISPLEEVRKVKNNKILPTVSKKCFLKKSNVSGLNQAKT